METLTAIDMKETFGGQIGLAIAEYSFNNPPPTGPVYVDSAGTGYPGEIWFP